MHTESSTINSVYILITVIVLLFVLMYLVYVCTLFWRQVNKVETTPDYDWLWWAWFCSWISLILVFSLLVISAFIMIKI